MWRHCTLVLSVVASTGAIAAAAPASTTPAPPQEFTQEVRPVLRIVRADKPLIIRGFNFKVGERVHVTGVVNETKVARILSSSFFGTFTINLGYDVSLAGCSGGAFLKAAGSLGSTAILKIPPKLCAVAAAP